MRKFIKENPKKSIFFGLILAIVLVIIITHKKNESGIASFTVDTGTISDILVLSGEVRPVEGAEMAFATSGMVAQVYKNPGDKVFIGEKIIELDNASLRADLARAKATLDLEKAQAEVSNAETDVDVRNAYNKLLSDGLFAYSDIQERNAYAPTISGTYTGGVEGAYKIEVINSGASASRYSIRFRGLETGETPITFYTAVPLGTKGLYMRFVQAYTGIGDEWTVKIPNREGENYTANLNAYNSALASSSANSGAGNEASHQVSDAKIRQAEADVASIVAKINERTLRAPFNGVVSKIDIKRGEIASSGKVITGVISDNAYEVVVEVPEVDVVALSVGLPVQIRLDAYGDVSFPATLTQIDPAETEVSGVSVYRAKVVFDQSDSRIRSGMTANVSILEGEVKDTLRLPSRFIESDSDGSFVMVKIDDELRKTYITTGLSGSDGLIQIVSGLTEGDVVVGNFK